MNNNINNNTSQVSLSSRDSLSYAELHDLQDCLRRPLTNRNVLIPLGPQAFVPGRLQPRRQKQEHQDNGSISSVDHEIVSIYDKSLGGNKDMTREEAISFLQTEMDQLLPPRPMTAKTSNGLVETSSSSGEPRTCQLSQSTTSRDAPTRESKNSSSSSSSCADETSSGAQPQTHNKNGTFIRQQEQPSEPQLPFFEIREELNETGKEVKAEAINVTKQLHMLEHQLRRQQPTNGSSGKASTTETSSSLSNNSKIDDVEMMETVDGGEEKKELQEKDKLSTTNITDTEYDALVTRLDELARLEEESEQKEAEKEAAKTRRDVKSLLNRQQQTRTFVQRQPSSSTGMAGGWNKGFLLNSKKPPSASPSSVNKKITPPTANHGHPEPKSLKSKAAEKHSKDALLPQAHTATEPRLPSSSLSSSRKVGFAADTQVQEIPRIGERSVRDIPRPIKPTKHMEGSSLFSGVVQERKRSSSRKSKKAIASTPVQQQHKQQQTAVTGGKRPLSQFAKQRQQYHLDEE